MSDKSSKTPTIYNSFADAMAADPFRGHYYNEKKQVVSYTNPNPFARSKPSLPEQG